MAYQLFNLEEHATFETIQEMDNTVRRYNARINHSHYETLNLLKQYSCKVIGVSHIKIRTIAEQLSKSVATVKRHIKYLKEHGFITVINTQRAKKGGKGANTYAINPFEIFEKTQRKIKNELSQMSYRKGDKKRNQHQSHQAMALVQCKKETMSFLKLLNSFISNKRRKKHIKLNRNENIKYFRACPEGVPIELYQAYKPFFSDAQIKCLFNIITKQTSRYSCITNDVYTDIVDTTFKSIVKALRKSFRGEKSSIQNIYAYTTGIAKKQSFKQASLIMWGLT